MWEQWIWLGLNNSKSVHFRVVNRGQERGDRGEGRFGVRTVLFNVNDKHASVATFQLRCTVYAYFVAKMSKIAITHFGGQV